MKSKVLFLKNAEIICDEEIGNTFLELGAKVDFLHINELKKEKKKFK